VFAQLGFKGETKRVLRAERREKDANLTLAEFSHFCTVIYYFSLNG